MKTNKRTAFLAVVLLLAISMIVPIWANVASTENTTAPTLFFSIDFEDMEVGAVASNTQIGEKNVLWLGNNQNIADDNGNKVLRSDKKAGENNSVNPDHCLFPFRALGGSNLSGYNADFVLSWDLFISDDDGSDINFISSKGGSWNKIAYILKSDTTATNIKYYSVADGAYKTSEKTVNFGAWNTYSIVVHPAAAGATDATYDLYVNGELWAAGCQLKTGADRFTLGKLFGAADVPAPADCYQMIDNIKCYSGSTPWTGEFTNPEDTTVTTPEATEPQPPVEIKPGNIFEINFDSVPVGAIEQKDNYYIVDAEGKKVDGLYQVIDGVTVIAERESGNNMTKFEKFKYSANVTADTCLWPFNNVEGVSTFDQYGKDLVLSYELFVSDDDGADFNLFAARSPDSARKWNRSCFIKVANENGQGALTYKNMAGEIITSDTTFTYGRWNRIAIVLHQAPAGSFDASYDLYINGQLMFSGAHMWSDTQRFTIGKFVSKDACPVNCYFAIDNIRMYEGNVLDSKDAEIEQPPVTDDNTTTEAPTTTVAPTTTDAPTTTVAPTTTEAPKTTETPKATTEAPTEETPVTEAQGTEAPDNTQKGGCGASVTVGVIGLVAVIACGAVSLKKKED